MNKISLNPTVEEKAEITRRIAAFSRSLHSQNQPAKQGITIEQFKALEAAVTPPVVKPAAATVESEPLHPTLQAMLNVINSREYRAAQTLKNLESLNDRRLLWDVIPVRDAVQAMGIQIYCCEEIGSTLRKDLGMSPDTAAAADFQNRRIIISMDGIYQGSDRLNLIPKVVLAGALLHECGHIVLGHGGSDRLSLPERMSRETLAWGWAEVMLYQHSLCSIIQPHTLRKMERFALSTYLA